MPHAMVINNHQPPSDKNWPKKCEKLPPLDHGSPEMTFTYFQHNCWKKEPKMKGHMPMISQESTKLYWNIVKKKIGKITPLIVKNGIFKKCQKSSISYGTRFSQPKYHIPT